MKLIMLMLLHIVEEDVKQNDTFSGEYSSQDSSHTQKPKHYSIFTHKKLVLITMFPPVLQCFLGVIFMPGKLDGASAIFATPTKKSKTNY